jgi:hypothetical protein
MDIFLTDESLAVEASMSDRDSEKLYAALQDIAADVEEAKRDPRHRYVSTYTWWATHIPGTRYTAFWYADDMLRVTLIADEDATMH